MWILASILCGPYCQAVWLLWKQLIKTANEWFHLPDRSSLPSPVKDVSVVNLSIPCRLDFKQNLKVSTIFAICSKVSTHCSDRHKATEPCLVYQKHLAAKIIFFSINQDWQSRKIGHEPRDRSCVNFKCDKLGCGHSVYQSWIQSWFSNVDRKTSTPVAFLHGGENLWKLQ